MPIVQRGARTSVFCAVWSGDPNRHALLAGHVACLEAQSAPVEAVYVFDNGDEPPPGLPGIHAVAANPLTIYEAWNVGSQVARTDWVMNLNLDDRLGPDAIRIMQGSAIANDADLVGAEWEIVFDQESTDAMDRSRPAHDLPYLPAWPPVAGVPTRLGSGTGERGTYGPGSLWRRSLHDQVPYPHRFADGTQIRSIGDMVWWQVITAGLGGRAIRVPMVVGRYHSHPSEQAEFRLPNETSKMSGGIDVVPFELDNVHVRRPALD